LKKEKRLHLRKALRVTALALFVFGISQAASAQGRWMFLGDKHVDGHDDHDKISISSKEGFSSTANSRESSAVVFKRVIVHFGNGADEELEFPRPELMPVARPGARSCEPIGSLRGEFWYEKARWASDSHSRAVRAEVRCSVSVSEPGAIATGPCEPDWIHVHLFMIMNDD